MLGTRELVVETPSPLKVVPLVLDNLDTRICSTHWVYFPYAFVCFTRWLYITALWSRRTTKHLPVTLRQTRFRHLAIILNGRTSGLHIFPTPGWKMLHGSNELHIQSICMTLVMQSVIQILYATFLYIFV